MRKFTEYYSADGTDCITGMKILPLQTSEFKTLLKSGIAYPQIYEMLDEAYGSAGAPKEWYENNIVKKTRLYENNNKNRS